MRGERFSKVWVDEVTDRTCGQELKELVVAHPDFVSSPVACSGCTGEFLGCTVCFASRSVTT